MKNDRYFPFIAAIVLAGVITSFLSVASPGTGPAAEVEIHPASHTPAVPSDG